MHSSQVCRRAAACCSPGARHVDVALDLEQRSEASDRLQRGREDRCTLAAFPGVLLDIGQLEKGPPRARSIAGVIGTAFVCGSNNGSKPL